MRKLTTHQATGLNEALAVEVLDKPGEGGACHLYRIRQITPPNAEQGFSPLVIHFQEGPIREAGVNGVSNEALLAIVEDRLRKFQAGDFACIENKIAMTHVLGALQWLRQRTLDREQRGVEGTNQP